MNRKLVAVLMVLSIFIGAAGMYAGIQWLGHDSAAAVPTEQNPLTNDSEQAAPKESPKQIAENMEKIQKAYEIISSRYVEETESDKLIEGAIQGMVDQLEDPYSVYMDKDTAEQFTQSLESSFEGIGAEVGMQNGKVTIVSPFKGSPAEKAGLQPNDQILKVDEEDIEGLDLYQAVLKIRGKKGTVVTLQIQRPGVQEPFNVEVTRDTIPIETVYSDTYEQDGKKVGYIQITSFSQDTGEDFKKQLAALEEQNIDGLVIDVRGNPGGLLDQVQMMASELVTKDKPYVQIEQRDGEKQRFFSSLTEKKPYEIVTLIDKGSASASEILAGALKEAGGYDIVGEASFGKGTVQQALDLGDGSNLKLTLYKWLTPDGNWIHKEGVKPTVEVKQPEYFYANPISLEEDEVLALDTNSEKVKNVQVMLKGLDFDPGREDGYFNKGTEDAVKKFQSENDLTPSGKVDSKTAEQLQAKLLDAVRAKENDVQLLEAMKTLFK
ncbi:Carboxy-terminal processing protease CtpB precursor [Bacillus sp. THAF10]|uniref:S41 family peptidase n=1 Tax=Bacillus sp. THAF10 TaxID=2587848 RepID=UPI001268A346|nr:S41 family peptidase [Bacillus sp. THAF10]QFT90627.1 Carboxy-terminal processing protease CtpB precursor [Bacillus sp. THAF10]